MITEKQKAMQDFEAMQDMAELRVFSNISLERPLTEDEFKRMMDLKRKLFK